MSIFRRRPRAHSPEEEDRVESFAEQENNPELLAAEREVNELPRHDGIDG